MSKKGKKGKKKRTLSKRIAPNPPVADLNSLLQNVYHDYISLETTCNHICECCNVAMPQINSCEFTQIITELWKKLSDEEKLNLITTSLEYFFKYDYEKWGGDSLIKPCMLLDSKTKLCKIYENRPLSCRMYGLWPKEDYEKRVDRFEKAYSKYGLKREDLPLHSQCQFVKRIDNSKPLTTEIIDGLFKKLDEIDKKFENFSSLQISQRENYRTFHDWLLLKVFGEGWLVRLTAFIMASDKSLMEEQLKTIKGVFEEKFLKEGIPDIGIRINKGDKR